MWWWSSNLWTVGNYLWSLEPSLNTGENPADQSFSGAAKDHFVDDLSRIHTFAIGVKVV